MIWRGKIALFGLAAVPYLLLAAAGEPAKPTYAVDVLPVLKAHCASCHAGPSASAGLDLTTTAGIKKVIVPRNSGASLLIQRMRGINGTQMPMGFAALAKETIDRMAEWIDGGALIDAGSGKHWAYIPPVKPKVPAFKSSHWVRNPIDAFVLTTLQKQGLKPSPEASKEKLIRRVYLDLIGLPPTPAQTDAFIADKRPDAYERIVDSLLKNPHYGERQAEPWLDLSRYADSDGYEKDLNRTAWKYRDWLIDAFNRNLPYDRFTTDQLAGDLLPNPTMEELIATGFNRNTMFNREGGVDQQEAHFNVVLDRVNTTATVWLGSTMQCSRCHDHKYDPFTQRDYYKLAAFFANSQIYPNGPKSVGEEKWFEAEIKAPTSQQQAEERKLKAAIADTQQKMLLWTPEVQKAYASWLDESKHGPAWLVFQPDKLSAKNGTILSADGFGVITASGPVPDQEDYVLSGKPSIQHITGISIEALPSSGLPSHGPGRADNGNFVLSTVDLSVGSTHATFATTVADFNQPGFEAARVNGKDRDSGWGTLGGNGKSHELVLELEKPIDVPADSPIQITIGQHWPGGKHSIGRLQVSVTSTEHPVALFLPPDIRKLIAVSDSGDAADKAVKDYFLKVTPLLEADRARVVSMQRELEKLDSKIATALIMRDKPHSGPLTAYVHSRGEFLTKTDLVTAGFPSFLGGDKYVPIEEAHLEVRGPMVDDPSNVEAPVPNINANGTPEVHGPVLTRLDLAKWLTSRGNPLTARVEVNRLWEQFFGRGIVETSEDFGTQGARPTHPELLDWLACEFMDKGWDTKAMVRLIVTSSTYRQASEATPAMIEKDPQNLYLERGPRFRLDAETIRDSMLSASGLLNTEVGGPSVFPFQPAGVWDTPYNGEQWRESKGSERYRRGIYTFMKRSSPYPSTLNFDGTSREECTVRRIRTNTPLQSLAMLNDGAVLDSARALGRRMSSEGGATPGSRLSFGFRLCTGRRPTEIELSRLVQLFTKLDTKYTAMPAEAKRLAGSPDAAAFMMVGNVLLNLDETVTKG